MKQGDGWKSALCLSGQITGSSSQDHHFTNICQLFTSTIECMCQLECNRLFITQARSTGDCCIIVCLAISQDQLAIAYIEMCAQQQAKLKAVNHSKLLACVQQLPVGHYMHYNMFASMYRSIRALQINISRALFGDRPLTAMTKSLMAFLCQRQKLVNGSVSSQWVPTVKQQPAGSMQCLGTRTTTVSLKPKGI